MSDRVRPGKRWWDVNCNPDTAYRRVGRSQGHITNSCGVGFQLHGSTKWEEVVALIDYLDRLEGAAARAGVDLDRIGDQHADHARRRAPGTR